MNKITRLFPALLMLIAFTACKQAAVEQDYQPVTPEEVCQHISFAWNLGNHFDSFGFPADANHDSVNYWDQSTSTEALYKNLAANGVKTVRIPVTWGAWEGEAPEYTINPDFMALVKQNVHWAKDNGLNVIINLHHDEYWLDIYNATLNDSINDAIMQRIERTWAQVAEAFKDEGNYLYFEAFNEIHAKTADLEDWSGEWARNNTKSLDIVNDWIDLAVRTIRATGSINATRWIVLNGYCGNPGLAMDFLRLPADEANRIMVSVHTYSPCDFTLEDKRETWGVGDQKAEDEQQIIDLFKSLNDRYTSQGIPVYLGEFGCDAHATAEGEACRLRYLSMIAQEARKANIPVILWDNSYVGHGPEHHAYFDHNDGHVVEGAAPIIEALVNAYK